MLQLITRTTMPYHTGIRLLCVAQNPANGFPARLLGFRRLGVYPRVGGGTDVGGAQQPEATGLSPRGRGNQSWPPSSPFSVGLSPRGRGNRTPNRVDILLSRSIPAWAGEPRWQFERPTLTQVYPRVGGGTHQFFSPTRFVLGLSPRGRGNQREEPAAYCRLRSIPAWAGEPKQ